MPSFYAHYYFGKEVIRQMPQSLKDTINTSKASVDAFIIGLQGPDILAFYKPYLNNDLNKQARFIHHSSGNTYFKAAIETVKQHDTPESRSYLLASLCHFMLDSECHKIVKESMTNLSVTHAKIEREFDNYLLYKNNKQRLGLDTSLILPRNTELGAIIAPFYKDVSTRNINGAIASMGRYLSLMSSKHKFVRASIYDILTMLAIDGVKDKRDMVIHDKNSRKCIESSEMLFAKLEGIVPDAVSEMKYLINMLHTDAPLSEYYKKNYYGSYKKEQRG